MELEDFKKLMAERQHQKEEMIKKDYAEHVKEHIVTNCMDKLTATRKNTIFLDFIETKEDEIPVGASKSGGYPDLPPSISIPLLSGYTQKYGNDEIHHNESSMQLIAQINLSEITAYDVDNRLPKEGMLYFFWSGELMHTQDTTFEGDNREVSRVIFYNGDLSLLKRTKPDFPYHDNFSEPLNVCRITPRNNRYLYDNLALEDIFAEEPEETAQSLIDDYELWEESGNRLLGYFMGSMNVTGGENLLLQFSYHEGCLWDIYWFISNKDLFEYKFENPYLDWDMD